MRAHRFIICAFLLLATCAFGEEWNKTYQVGNNASLRVDTNDGAIEVTPSGSNTISARVLIDGYKPGDVRVSEHQNGDHVDLQVHVPRQIGIFLTPLRVRIQMQVPGEAALDLHSGDGHISLESLSGKAKLDTSDGHISIQNHRGEVNAHTRDGHITADGVFSAVELETGDGRIEFTARPGSKISSGWLIRTHDGRVEVRLPGDLAADLYAHSGDGHITLDLPVEVNGSFERSHVRGKINGGGAQLEISTGDGNIRVGKY